MGLNTQNFAAAALAALVSGLLAITPAGAAAKRGGEAEPASDPKPLPAARAASAKEKASGEKGAVVDSASKKQKKKKKKPGKKKPNGKKAAKTDEGKPEKSATKRPKKVAARATGKKHGSTGSRERAKPPCVERTVTVDRGGLESESLVVVDCAGKPVESSRLRLSVLARPWGAARPVSLPAEAPAEVASGKPPAPAKGAISAKDAAGAARGEIAPGVRLLDPGLLVRIDALARKYPGKVFSVVSGYRPGSQGSLHQTARALDVRIAGVENAELAAACRSLGDTGCGYYPNSSFVHVDVRAPGTGTVAWIDASGPGEPPRYVTQWPPPAEPEAAPPDVALDPAAPAAKPFEAPAAARAAEPAPEAAIPAEKETPPRLAEAAAAPDGADQPP